MRLETSPNTRFKSLANKWLNLVKKHGEINKHELIVKLGLTPQQYYLNAPTIQHMYADEIEYDKVTKLWRVFNATESNG